jgi:putative transcriptional regulator
MSKPGKVQSFRRQMAESMAELDMIVAGGQSFSGNGRFTVRTTRVPAPSVYGASSVRSLRRRLEVSQGVFAQLLGVSQVLVRAWERGARTPAPVACRLLDIFRVDPRMPEKLMRRSASESSPARHLRLNRS